MTEKQIEKKILRFLRAQPETWAVKVRAGNYRGVPDILCCHRGMFLALEVKKPGGRTTDLQDVQLGRIHMALGVSKVVASVKDVEDTLIELAKNERAKS